MKTMKKAIAVVLCMIIIVALIPFSGVSALESTAKLTLDTFTSLKFKGDGATVSFTVPEDGFYKFLSKGSSDTYATLYDSQENMLCENDDVDIENGDYNFSLSYKLNVGQTYYLSVNAWESEYATISTKVKVVKIEGIESSKIVSLPDDTTCIEGYEENTINLDGLAIDYTFSDGSVVNWVYGGEWSVKEFEISCDFDFDEDGNFFVTLDCGGVVDRIDYTTVENPVDYLEYVGDDLQYYVNSNGYYNEYLGYYYYYLDFPTDSYVAIHYKDGTVKNARFRDKVDGYYIESYTTQMDESWSIGENTAYVCYLGVETEVKVNILPSPFKKITLNRAPTKEYVLGDFLSGELTPTKVFEFYPYDISGMSFTVEYHDGTKRTFFDKDFDIENGTIDGYEYSVTQCSAVIPKTCRTTFTYMGYELSYDVKVVESPIENLEIVWYPELSDYEESYKPIFDGMEIELSYKDGTKKTVVFSDENTNYGENGFSFYRVNTESEELYIMQSWDYMGEAVYLVGCYDKYVEYSGIAFYEDEEVESIAVSDFSFENMTIDVTYANGTTDALQGDIVNIDEFEKGCYSANVKTKNGILEVGIDTLYENSEIIGYEINALGNTAQVSGRIVKKGDVDLNDVVSVLDATKIQRYLSRYEKLSELQHSAADTDGDGEITVMDVTRVQRYAAKQIVKI